MFVLVTFFVFLNLLAIIMFLDINHEKNCLRHIILFSFVLSWEIDIFSSPFYVVRQGYLPFHTLVSRLGYLTINPLSVKLIITTF